MRLLNKDLSNEVVLHEEVNGVQYIQFRKLLKYQANIIHCFSTRIGGVSEGECSQLNLGFNRKDSSENVIENFRRLCSVIGINYMDLVFSNQVHGDVIKQVDEKNKGEGIVKEKSSLGYDGMITCSPGVPMITFYADCVPILFYDPVKNVAGMCHSGWRGTVKKIATKMVKIMKNVYDCNPREIIACIGPSIGQCCFEVDDDVRNEFEKAFRFWKEIIQESGTGKSKIDLWRANQLQLEELGLLKENIQISGLCTACNNDVFFSYRADKGKTGSMGAIIQIIS